MKAILLNNKYIISQGLSSFVKLFLNHTHSRTDISFHAVFSIDETVLKFG